MGLGQVGVPIRKVRKSVRLTAMGVADEGDADQLGESFGGILVSLTVRHFEKLMYERLGTDTATAPSVLTHRTLAFGVSGIRAPVARPAQGTRLRNLLCSLALRCTPANRAVKATATASRYSSTTRPVQPSLQLNSSDAPETAKPAHNLNCQR